MKLLSTIVIGLFLTVSLFGQDDNIKALVSQGTELHDQGKYDEAIKYCKRVIEQNSDNQQAAYVVLGSALDMKDKPNDAIKAYEEGLTKYPNSNLLNYNLALTAYKIGDDDKAEQYKGGEEKDRIPMLIIRYTKFASPPEEGPIFLSNMCFRSIHGLS